MSIIIKNIRVCVAPQKVRQVCDLIRMKKASEALRILRFCEKKEIAIVLTKMINNGLEIALSSDKYDLDGLIVGNIYADGGPTLKRVQPRAQGRAFRIRKRTSHIWMELKEE